jgi:hypothetical protein
MVPLLHLWSIPMKEDAALPVLNGHCFYIRGIKDIDLASENSAFIVFLPPHSRDSMQLIQVRTSQSNS